MTMTQKILAAKAGLRRAAPGELITLPVNIAMGNDITAPVAINELVKHGKTSVKAPDNVVFVADHFTPNKDIKAAENVKQVRNYAAEHGIRNFFDVGRMGIEHCLLPEAGFVKPGDVIIGADSHTCTYGALGAFATGMGSTDLAYAIHTGNTWLRVPDAIRFHLTGTLRYPASGKDLILTIIGKIGVEGALYQSMEFTGNGVRSLSMDDRFTIANMAIEAGAKNGIFPVDEAALEYLESAGVKPPYSIYEADADAPYAQTIEIDLEEIEPVAACPHLPSNVRKIASAAAESKAEFIAVDQVVIGSCTNGRLSDLRIAAEVIKGHKIKDSIRCIVIPGTQKIFRECLREGIADVFVEAGAAFSTPTCGPCLGGHMGVLAEKERAVSTTNRNFVGRMGAKTSEIYLASPYTAAKCAIEGGIYLES